MHIMLVTSLVRAEYLPEGDLELSPASGEDGEQEDVVGEGDQATPT